MPAPAVPATEPTIAPLEAHVGFWLRYVSNHVSAGFARKVEERGVSVSEWVAMRCLYDADQVTTQELIRNLGMTKGAVSKIITRLEAKDYVMRDAALDDQRAQFVRLTEAGRALVPELARLADENDAAFFGGLTQEQRDTLVALMMELVRTNKLAGLPVS